MEQGSMVLEDIVFRGVEFTIKIEVENGALIVEISDIMTADQWKGDFDPPSIEELTKRTGNFKEFSIFCGMLESAVKKTSDSVTLDLLTYDNLELVRNRKAGVVGCPRGRRQSPALRSKRYLIVIYTVEFDRIHYPLPLSYLGKPDPAALQREIRALRTELIALSSHGGHKPAEVEIQRLRAELALVKQEKEAMAKALGRLQMGMGDAPSGREAWRAREVMRNLEEQLVKERAKSQRFASKRGQEQYLLMEQLEELRTSECALRDRVKSLTTELALLRRGRVTPVRQSAHADGLTYRSLSRERRSGHSVGRARSSSRERIEDRLRSEERCRRADSSGPRGRIRRPSPSPTRSARFDPTAYIQERQRRQQEADTKKERKIRRNMVSPVLSERGRSRSRDAYPPENRSGSRGRRLSIERRGSRHSSGSSLADMDEMAKTLIFRGRKPTYNGPSMSRGDPSARRPLCSTPTRKLKLDKGSSIDTGAEMSDIEDRLQALQECMKDLDTGH